MEHWGWETRKGKRMDENTREMKKSGKEKEADERKIVRVNEKEWKRERVPCGQNTDQYQKEKLSSVQSGRTHRSQPSCSPGVA